MIGGKIENVFMFEDRLSVLVRGTDMECNDLLVIDLPYEAALLGIGKGDGIWWQSDIALWTPQNDNRQDVHVPRMGYSYRPEYLWPKVIEACKAGICPECTCTDTMHDGNGGLWCPRCGASYLGERS